MKQFLAKALLATSLLSSSFIHKVEAMGGSGPFEGLKDYANSVTLGIETPASSGSGILIGKKGNKYFFLTASHVAISDPKNEEYWVYSVAGGKQKKFQVISFERPAIFADKDIVIGSFESKDNLPIALIFPLNRDKGILPDAFGKTTENTDFHTETDQWIIDGRDWPIVPQELRYTWIVYKTVNGRAYNKEWDIQGSPLIGGVSIPTKAVPVPLMRVTEAQMQARVNGNERGYEAIYQAISTVPGMSGGGIYAARTCPELIVTNIASNEGKIASNEDIKRLRDYYKKMGYQDIMLIQLGFTDEVMDGREPVPPDGMLMALLRSNGFNSSEEVSANKYREVKDEFLGLYPGVIAMHGMSEEYLTSGGRSGTSLGIPLDIFRDFFKKNSSKYGIIDGKAYNEKVIELCLNKTIS